MCKVSIIIPMYNAEKYVRKCIENIINQTIGFEEIEVIIIDDCSNDNSIKIAKEYEEKYKNIKVIKTDKNTGIAGRARNIGMQDAKGKYLMFSDADDFFELNACEILYNFAEDKSADFVTANYQNTDEDGTPWSAPIFDKNKYGIFKLDSKDYINSFFVLNSSVCNKIFKREFVEKYNIKFLEGVPAEDAYFSYSAMMHTDNIYYNNNVVYNYRNRSKSETLSVSWNCSKDYFEKINESYKKIYQLFKENERMDYYKFFYAKNMTYMLYKFIDSQSINYDERIEILSEMRWFYKLSLELNVPACQESLSVIINKIIAGEYKDTIDICKVIADIRSYLPKEIREKMSKPTMDFYKKMLKTMN